ncbi:MAG: class I SAM-dependent methyltransferase [gamma proteobacterium symbiont of Taylorina sp.]|nr:class I SAM-dependent methyltransferase [gamma proteobacterium symbiont of Taylorina sp.]
MSKNLNTEEIHEFYLWIRDYWSELSADDDGTLSHVLNFGVWESDTVNLFRAQEVFRKKMTDWLGNIDSESQGLEIGCGIGGFAVQLVAEKKVQLRCLDLLPEHLELSASYAEEMNVKEKMNFQEGSSMHMSLFDDNCFDFAYCIESSFHYTDKEQFFKEIYRILKPGGIFVIADITCEDNRKITFKQGNFFPSSAEFSQYFDGVGFTQKQYSSIGGKVYNQLLSFVKQYNQKNGKRDKLTKYWERVLTNYSDLYNAGLMDYEMYQLQK